MESIQACFSSVGEVLSSGFNSFCESAPGVLKAGADKAYEVVAWAGNGIAAGWTDYAWPALQSVGTKVAEFARGIFANAQAWVQANPDMARAGVIGIAIGVLVAGVAALAFNCCRSSAPGAPST